MIPLGSNKSDVHRLDVESSLLDSDDNLPSRCSSFPTSCWTQFTILLHRYLSRTSNLRSYIFIQKYIFIYVGHLYASCEIR